MYYRSRLNQNLHHWGLILEFEGCQSRMEARIDSCHFLQKRSAGLLASPGGKGGCALRTEFMCQHSNHLLLAALLDQRIEQHDALVLPESVHVGIGVRTPLGPINHKQLPQGEVQRPC